MLTDKKRDILELWHDKTGSRIPASMQAGFFYFVDEITSQATPAVRDDAIDYKVVKDALEAMVKMMVDSYNAWMEEDPEMLAAIDKGKEGLKELAKLTQKDGGGEL